MRFATKGSPRLKTSAVDEQADICASQPVPIIASHESGTTEDEFAGEEVDTASASLETPEHKVSTCLKLPGARN